MVNFLASNWVWILFLGGMLVMHLGHGGHGGHGGGCGGGHSTHDDAANTHDTGVDAADGDGDHSPVTSPQSDTGIRPTERHPTVTSLTMNQTPKHHHT